MRDIVAVVPVRGGSKGLPGKNVRLLNGIPLYQYAVNQGVRTAGQCLITTDIEEILLADLPCGCEAMRRPTELAGDDAPMASAIYHLIKQRELFDVTIVLLQATSPLRLDSDIEQAIKLHASGRYDLVMSVTRGDSGILKYGLFRDGYYIPVQDPEYCFTNRQQLPPIYCPNGAVYVFTAKGFLEAGGFPYKSIGAIEMPPDRSVDIDSESDFSSIEHTLKRQFGR